MQQARPAATARPRSRRRKRTLAGNETHRTRVVMLTAKRAADSNASKAHTGFEPVPPP
jgi:hypothetical protein